MKKYKISCENAEVKAEAIKLFESLGYQDLDTKDHYLDLVAYADSAIQSITIESFVAYHQEKQITIEKLRKMAKPIECLVKTDNGWEYKVLPKSLTGDAVKIPKKANFAVESIVYGRDDLGTVAFYKQHDGGDHIFPGSTKWHTGGCGIGGRTPIWQRTEKSKFIVKTKLGYEVQELPKDTPVTWHCIPLVDGVPESDQIEFYELCDKVEAIDFRGAEWMRENIQNYGSRVDMCFTWSSTPQGGDYWRLINDLIK